MELDFTGAGQMFLSCAPARTRGPRFSPDCQQTILIEMIGARLLSHEAFA